MKYLLLLTIPWLSYSNIASQTHFLNFHQLTTKEGLSASNNHFLYMDQNRYTWIGSMDGLNLFDGKEVQIFKTESNTDNLYQMKGRNIQSSFFEDSNGDIWFATDENLNCYRRDSKTFEVPIENADNSIPYVFHLDKNQILWTVFEGKLRLFNTEKNSFIPRTSEKFAYRHAGMDITNKGEVRSIYAFNSGFYGFEVRNYDNYKLIGEPEVYFNHKSDSPYKIYHVIPNVIGNSEACFLTDRGLLFFDPLNPENVKPYPFPSNCAPAISLEKVGNELWMVNNTSEIIQFDLEKDSFSTKKYTAYNLDEKSKIKGINRIFLGKDSTLWISVKGQGVFYANLKNTWTYSLFEKNNIQQNSMSNIFKDLNGNLIGVAESGYGIVFGNDKTYKDTVSFPKYFKAIRTNNQIWAISTKGIGLMKSSSYRFDWRPFPSQYGNSFILDLISYNDAFLLLATSDGIFSYNIKANKFDQITSGFIVELFLDSKDRLWAADGENNLEIWQLNKNKPTPNFPPEPLKSFTEMGTMNQFAEDALRNSVWIATSRGLVNIPSSLSKKISYTKENGLPNSFIHAVLLDKNQNIWISSNKGITRFNPDASIDNRFKHLSIRDGLSGEEFYDNSAMKIDNELWFGSTKGIDIINSDIQNIGIPPRLEIKDLSINDQKWIGEKPINKTKKIILDHDENNLTFKLSALEYTDPVRNKFKVYLISEQRIDSVLIEKDNIIRYANLAPGNYTFQVTACNAEGLWQKKKKELQLKIVPHFTQTWWFQALISLVLFSIILSAIIYYYRNQLKIRRLRERISADMHDRLGKYIATISNISERIKDEHQLGDNHDIQKIISAANSLRKIKKDLIWTLDSESSTLDLLIYKIRHDIAELLSDNKIEYSINMPEIIPKIEITSSVKGHLLCVVDEVLTNILRYAHTNKVEVAMALDALFTIQFWDFGVGFDPDTIESNGDGIKNCKNRIESFGGEILWDKTKDKGMLVTIKINYKKLS